MTEGTIFLLGPLDFEKQAMYHLTVLANVSNFFHFYRKTTSPNRLSIIQFLHPTSTPITELPHTAAETNQPPNPSQTRKACFDSAQENAYRSSRTHSHKQTKKACR
uniref:Cadherin-86C n=1 Tax=Culex pipiens TaxID=7175 RepID=A0A8D8B6C0_CULPI